MNKKIINCLVAGMFILSSNPGMTEEISDPEFTCEYITKSAKIYIGSKIVTGNYLPGHIEMITKLHETFGDQEEMMALLKYHMVEAIIVADNIIEFGKKNSNVDLDTILDDVKKRCIKAEAK